MIFHLAQNDFEKCKWLVFRCVCRWKNIDKSHFYKWLKNTVELPVDFLFPTIKNIPTSQ